MRIFLDRNVTVKDYNDWGLLINVELALYQRVNGTGLLVTQAIQETPGCSMEEISAKMAQLYGIPEKLVREDINKFINKLVEEGFFHFNEVVIAHPENEIEDTDKRIWFQITNKCNLHCKYCYADAGNSIEDLKIEEIENILQDLKGYGYNEIAVTGGEPLMRKDIIDILDVCRKHGKVMLLTNGTLGDRKLYERILDRVEMIQISLDSCTKEINDRNRGEGSLEKAINTIKFLSAKCSDKVAIAMTPTPEFAEDLEKMIQLCLEYNVMNLHVNKFAPLGRAKSGYNDDFDLKKFYNWADKGYKYLNEEYLKAQKEKRVLNFNLDIASDLRIGIFNKFRKFSCGLNHNLISVAYNGNVYLCPSLHNDQYKLGSIRHDNIVNIINNTKKKYGVFHVENLKNCKKCDIKYYCGGGCRALALHNGGDIYGEEMNCESYRERVYSLMLRQV